jgi:hypothetical protein
MELSIQFYMAIFIGAALFSAFVQSLIHDQFFAQCMMALGVKDIRIN